MLVKVKHHGNDWLLFVAVYPNYNDPYPTLNYSFFLLVLQITNESPFLSHTLFLLCPLKNHNAGWECTLLIGYV